jgi:hypothetical protein
VWMAPTDKAGRDPVTEGCVEVHKAAALVRENSGTALRLESDVLPSGVMIVRRETEKNNRLRLGRTPARGN